jgi:hypothetical protein
MQLCSFDFTAVVSSEQYVGQWLILKVKVYHMKL